MDFAKNDPLGFRYIERMNIKPKKYNKKNYTKINKTIY